MQVFILQKYHFIHYYPGNLKLKKVTAQKYVATCKESYK